MFKFSLLKISLLSIFVAPCLSASPLKVLSGSASFIATGKPGFLKINGTGPEIKGNLDKGEKSITGDLSVPMEKFVTGIDLRDEHMKEKYFEVKKYPESTLKITSFDLDASGQAKEKPFKGVLKLHGIEKEVSGTASLSNDGTKQNIEASFPITLSDFKIDVPTYAGVKVADTVQVQAKLQTEAAK